MRYCHNIIIISEVKERNHGDANTHSCIHILLSQIISIYDITTKFHITKRFFCFSDEKNDGKYSFYATENSAETDFIYSAFRSIEE